MTKLTHSIDSLWNDTVLSKDYRPGAAAYQTAVLEQWKMLVETSERVSTRRSLTNTFFLAINSVAVTILGIFWPKPTAGLSVWWILLPLTILLITCFSWFLLVISYRRLNKAKFAIIHSLEELLPARVFVNEWELIQRRGNTRYIPFTAVEIVVPIIFAVTYITAGVLAIVTAL
ncbi:RipA family octameric membrane protein [Kocuria sabuli]|uniref:RipA family octameric membrane protein n=1 Tax=Kocuria sabuli TaxID=3071448 RepID=UPI0034D45E6B